MSDDSYWEYQLQSSNGEWRFASASGQTEPHHYKSRDELMGILNIIHPGERVRIIHIEEVEVPAKS